MKLKHMFITLGLALGLGVGVAAGIGGTREAKSVHADPSTKTLYLCVNWGDWASPKIHYWGGADGTEWESLPSLTVCEYAVINSDNEGAVYKYDMPTDVTHFLITKSDKSAQTADFDFSGTWGAYANSKFWFVWDDVNKKNLVEPNNFSFLEDGYYIAGDDNFVAAVGQTGTAWKIGSGVKMDDATMVGTNKATYIMNVGEDDVEFKPIHLVDGVADWLGASNLTITEAGKHVVYVQGDEKTSTGSGVYIDAFCASFLGDMQGVCGTTAAEWEKSHAGDSLNAVWAKHKTRFEGWLADAAQQAAFVTTSGNAGVARAATLYAHAKARYSLSAWTGAPAASAGTLSTYSNNSNNSGTIIIAVISSVTVLVIVGFYFYRRRKLQ